MKIYLTFVVIMLLVCAYPAPANLVNTTQQKSQTTKQTGYACPMHPEVTGRKGGKCHKCGMALRPRKTETTSTREPKAEESVSPAPEVVGALQKIPDVMVIDQNGKRLRFHSDLIAGKVVAINFVFTTCTAICPLLSANFRRVQQELAKKPDLDVRLISISVDPTTDTQERLHDFAAHFKAGPNWTFVTGDKREIDSILQALGAGITDKNDHTPMVLIGNDKTGYWTRTYGLISPVKMAKLISDAGTNGQ